MNFETRTNNDTTPSASRRNSIESSKSGGGSDGSRPGTPTHDPFRIAYEAGKIAGVTDGIRSVVEQQNDASQSSAEVSLGSEQWWQQQYAHANSLGAQISDRLWSAAELQPLTQQPPEFQSAEKLVKLVGEMIEQSKDLYQSETEFLERLYPVLPLCEKAQNRALDVMSIATSPQEVGGVRKIYHEINEIHQNGDDRHRKIEKLLNKVIDADAQEQWVRLHALQKSGLLAEYEMGGQQQENIALQCQRINSNIGQDFAQDYNLGDATARIMRGYRMAKAQQLLEVVKQRIEEQGE